MNLTIEINNKFYKVEAKKERGNVLLNNFIDGVVEAKELMNKQYKSILNITLLATID